MNQVKVLVLIGISSDIGTALAQKYSNAGYTIIGTYRNEQHIKSVSALQNCHLFKVNFSRKESIEKFVTGYAKLSLPWDLLISCPGTVLPIGNFFTLNFEDWSNSIHVNAIEHLRVLHGLYPYRRKGRVCDAVFLAEIGR